MSTYFNKLISLIKKRSDSLTIEQRQELIDVVNTRDSIMVPLEDNTFEIIKVVDMYYVEEPKKGKVFINTIDRSIEYKNSAFNLIDYIEKHNEKFYYLNKGLVVNIDKIIKYDSYYRKIYFSNNKETIVTGAAIQNIVAKLLGKEKDVSDIELNGNYEY